MDPLCNRIVQQSNSLPQNIEYYSLQAFIKGNIKIMYL